MGKTVVVAEAAAVKWDDTGRRDAIAFCIFIHRQIELPSITVLVAVTRIKLELLAKNGEKVSHRPKAP